MLCLNFTAIRNKRYDLISSRIVYGERISRSGTLPASRDKRVGFEKGLFGKARYFFCVKCCRQHGLDGPQ